MKVNKEIIIVIKEDGTLYCNNFIEGLNNIKEHILQFPKDTPIHINSDKMLGLIFCICFRYVKRKQLLKYINSDEKMNRYFSSFFYSFFFIQFYYFAFLFYFK